MAEAKLTRAETHRHLSCEEMKRVVNESNAQLERRRGRYLAVLDFSKRHRLKHLSRYFAGIPDKDLSALICMSLDEFREAVLLKLDAPSGLRYKVSPLATIFSEGEPVWVTFRIENVTARPIRLKYAPSVEVVDSSNTITARGALVWPKGKNIDQRRIPYGSKFVRPFKEMNVTIAPGEAFTNRVNLLEFYDLPPARYTISARLDIPRSDQANFWHGSAMADTVSFEINSRDKK